MSFLQQTPLLVPGFIFLGLALIGLFILYIALHLVAPKPRPALPSEKTYITTLPSGETSESRQLPCWYDRWLAERQLAERQAETVRKTSPLAKAFPPDPTVLPQTAIGDIEPASVCVSLVIPAYNEEARLARALDDAIEYLDKEFGRPDATSSSAGSLSAAVSAGASSRSGTSKRSTSADGKSVRGYEIIIVNDGSSDNTVGVALECSRRHGLHDILRVVTLERNRGKGGGVTHGFRHVRGEWVLFADADGATRFADLGSLIEACQSVLDSGGRGVAVGSRAHLVGSDVVVKRSAIRNFLMRSFHLVLTILTPPATSRLKDTQCGFKLFSRASLPHIVPYMHTEGWIFDIEMLMLAESAPPVAILRSEGSVVGHTSGIRVAEVPVTWQEVEGSKMSLVRDSVTMALGLAVLRASWMFGVYRRRVA